MKKLLFAFLTLICFTAFAQESKVINDPNAVVRSLNAGFTAIAVSSGIELFLTQGNEESLAVSANDKKYLDRLKTEVVNGTLKIYYHNHGITWKSGKKKNLKAYVSCKTLEKLGASAGSEVNVNGTINSRNFSLDVSSGADFEGSLQVTELAAEITSGASVKISGKADKLKVAAGSGAEFKGYDLTVEYCDAKASSGANVMVKAIKN